MSPKFVIYFTTNLQIISLIMITHKCEVYLFYKKNLTKINTRTKPSLKVSLRNTDSSLFLILLYLETILMPR